MLGGDGIVHVRHGIHRGAQCVNDFIIRTLSHVWNNTMHAHKSSHMHAQTNATRKAQTLYSPVNGDARALAQFMTFHILMDSYQIFHIYVHLGGFFWFVAREYTRHTHANSFRTQ